MSEVGPIERGILLGLMLASGKSVTTRLIRETFGVSPATAKRDLLILETTARANAVVGGNRQVTLMMTPDQAGEGST